jgi:hypothetical protein
MQEREKLFKEKKVQLRRNVAKALKNFGGPKPRDLDPEMSIGQRTRMNQERMIRRMALRVGKMNQRRDKRFQKKLRQQNSNLPDDVKSRSSIKGLKPIKNLLEGCLYTSE